ncbi:MAG: hypothetical protein AB7L09_01175 [Nitrospira sp.]
MSSIYPNIPIQITSLPVVAQPRKLQSTWSRQAVDDFLNDFGLSRYPRLPDNDLDRMRDALEDPNYDPNDENYKGLWRWQDGRIATPSEVRAAHPESGLVEAMANEMASEIDREIMSLLKAPRPPAAHRGLVKVLNAVELSSTPRWCKDAARSIIVRNLGGAAV